MGRAVNFDWKQPIIQVPLRQMYPELGKFHEFAEKKVIVNKKKDELFGVVNERRPIWPHYKLIDTIKPVVKEVCGNFSENISGFRRGGKLHGVLTLDELGPVMKGKYETLLRLIVLNSYDGSWSPKIILGAFTVVCSNGLIVGRKLGVIGIKDFGSEKQILVRKVNGLITNGKKLSTIWKKWQEIKLTKEESLELLAKIYQTKKLEDTIAKVENFPTTKWELYNAATNISTHNVRSDLRRVDFDRTIGSVFYDDVLKMSLAA